MVGRKNVTGRPKIFGQALGWSQNMSHMHKNMFLIHIHIPHHPARSAEKIFRVKVARFFGEIEEEEGGFPPPLDRRGVPPSSYTFSTFKLIPGLQGGSVVVGHGCPGVSLEPKHPLCGLCCPAELSAWRGESRRRGAEK